MIIMICITIIAIALAGYFARRAKLMEKRKIRASLKSAETEIALRRSLKNLGTAYEKIKAHSVARCGKCGRLYTWKQVADLGNYYVCENCEAKRSRSIVESNSKNEIKQLLACLGSSLMRGRIVESNSKNEIKQRGDR